MRDTAEAEFDCVNYLVDHHLAEVVLLLCIMMNDENETVQIADLVESKLTCSSSISAAIARPSSSPSRSSGRRP